MDTAQIETDARRVSFRPFALALVKGETLTVGEPREINLSPHPPHIVTVFTRDGDKFGDKTARLVHADRRR